MLAASMPLASTLAACPAGVHLVTGVPGVDSDGECSSSSSGGSSCICTASPSDSLADSGPGSATASPRKDLSAEPVSPVNAAELADKLIMGSLRRQRQSEDSWYSTTPTRARHEALLRKALDVILEEAVFAGTDRANKVCEWRDPEELRRIMDLSLPHGDGEAPADDATLLGLIQDTIKYSVKTGHPYFINQLYSGLDPYGLLGQWLTDALNPSVYTYEVSPVFTLMEETVLREMRNVVGFAAEQGDGIFCPGGSMANGYAISCARYHRFPEVKTKGMHGLPRLAVFTSEDAHYSVLKMATLMGLGAESVFLVRTDARGRMDAAHLEEQVAAARGAGAHPLMVSATAGTTVLGAFDPIEALSETCRRHGMWLHVDAAWGGGALMSRRRRHLLKGVALADSVTWNPHKLLAAPQQCSTFLTRHAGVLGGAHSAHAAYLFQPDKFYDTRYDTGDKHVQCGRRADVLKFWFMWKAKGTAGLEKHIDHLFDNATYFKEAIRCRPGWELVLREPECTNVCFWYVPPSLRGQQHRPDYHERLHKVAPKIKERMMKEGAMMVTYQPLRGLPNFFRLVLQSSATTVEDMDHFIGEVERLGCDL